MRRRLFEFRKTDRLSMYLTIASILSFVLAAILFFLGGKYIIISNIYVGEPHYTAWFMIFLILGIMLLLLGCCLRTVCDDVSDQLKLLRDELRRQMTQKDNE